MNTILTVKYEPHWIMFCCLNLEMSNFSVMYGDTMCDHFCAYWTRVAARRHIGYYGYQYIPARYHSFLFSSLLRRSLRVRPDA
eukprot:232173-Pleurochrysis_carterae.AAC.1